jgi:hypothetical protein
MIDGIIEQALTLRKAIHHSARFDSSRGVRNWKPAGRSTWNQTSLLEQPRRRWSTNSCTWEHKAHGPLFCKLCRRSRAEVQHLSSNVSQRKKLQHWVLPPCWALWRPGQNTGQGRTLYMQKKRSITDHWTTSTRNCYPPQDTSWCPALCPIAEHIELEPLSRASRKCRKSIDYHAKLRRPGNSFWLF